MATRGLIESSIDAFWSTAGAPRPTTPQDLLRRNQPGRKPGVTGSKSARGRPLCLGTGVAAAGSHSARTSHSARRAAPDQEAHTEFRHVTVELSGREGFNSIAVNGIWRFWRVKNGRLAFRRDVELQVEPEDVEEEGCSDDSTSAGADTAAKQRGTSQTGVATVRLFLFYTPQVDSWLISDSSDTSGSVTADCGPVGEGEDFGNHWRIWDGEQWCEDRNIVVEVALGGPGFPNLKGLRVATAASTKQRAFSQEPRTTVPRAPSSDKPLDSARPRRSSRR